ncbi:unnamed protein product [Lymnaea stagnalis]|uniref:G patch domain-containing protein 4 n=1 Tax=Lymnaea stagnalis TaxID=6523 RepID=A0AAV2H032_LYMST
MADSDFAKRQLRKYGWTEGAGLGKQENGRSDPIKVSLKMDKTGVGHDPGKEFTDHWWLRVFNEAAQKIGQNKTNISSESTKKSEDKKNFYKGFVKSSTLSNGIEKANKDSDSSDEESNDGPKVSLPTLDDIHKFCGGATGHRAAMFGIKMKGKLSRVAEQDQQFEEQLKKKENRVGDCTQEKRTSDEVQNRPNNDTDKKMKKKKRVDHADITESQNEMIDNREMETTQGRSEKKHKKKKRKKDKHDSKSIGVDEREEEIVEANDLAAQPESKSKKRKVVEADVEDGAQENTKLLKKKRKRSKAEKHDDKETDNFHIPSATVDITGHEIITQKKKKKRPKSEKLNDNEADLADTATVDEVVSVEKNGTSKKKKKKNV